MIPGDPPQPDTSRLVRPAGADEQAVGGGPPPHDSTETAPKSFPRLKALESVRRRLARAWPRGKPAAGMDRTTDGFTGTVPEGAGLTRLFEACRADVEAGRAVDVDRLAAEHPAFAGRLRACLPGLLAAWADGAPPAPVIDIAAPGFEVREEIGRGGMGVVYRAEQTKLGREVALKVLPPALAADPDRLRRFRKEAVIAAGLNDSRIVPIHDVLEVGGALILVMPLVDGPDLGRILRDRKAARGEESAVGEPSVGGPVDRAHQEEVLPLLDQLVDAVAVIHGAKVPVLHRDIKPSNVLVDGRGQVFLSDFGLARLADESGATAPGPVGSPGYMAPEQWQALDDLDFRADVFGLGATLYRALTLQLPYGQGVLTSRTPPLPRRVARRHRLPSHLAPVILKALAPDRRDRYASAVELKENWHLARRREPLKDPRFGRLREIGLGTRRHRRLAVNLAIVAAALIALAVVLASANRKPPGPDDPRPVLLDSDPPGARLVFVPLDRRDGEPLPGKILPAGGAAMTPARLDIPPGDYLVVVVWPDGRFHEVYRHVPRPDEDEISPVYSHTCWAKMRDGTLRLARIGAPRPGLTDDMVYISGADDFAPPADPAVTSEPPQHKAVRPFYYDRTEVTLATYGELGQEMGALPKRVRPSGPGDRPRAVRGITFNKALHVAETLGKRLPDGAEYLFVATNGGRTRYPWGDEEPADWGPAWGFGPVGAYPLDRALDWPGVAGLFSNVGEWALTWPTAGRPAIGEPGGWKRVICGAPPSVIRGGPPADDSRPGPALRFDGPRDGANFEGVGFRCARSARPRFLH